MKDPIATTAHGVVCVCADCHGDLESGAGDAAMICTRCAASFPFRDGVLMLLRTEVEDEQRRYLAAYDRVSRDDLEQPFEHDRASRHETLTRFIGDVQGRSILDIGSSDATYLRTLDARLKVALDIAHPYLAAIPDDADVVTVCADAENLPVRAGAWDVIVLSDVLEHVLDAGRVVSRITQVARPDTRVIVHVPWRENLAKYADSPYEFTHLRSFDDYSFSLLWHRFSVRRHRATHPSLEEPVIFQLRRFLPLRLYDRLLDRYFNHGLAEREYTARARWIAELPRRERALLLVYPPKFRMFELRLREQRRSDPHGVVDAVRKRLSARASIRR